MAGIQIQIVSDLHLEYNEFGYSFDITPTAPHLALLGDIGNTHDEELYNFLTRHLLKYKTIFYLLGNHEPYHSTWPAARLRLGQFAEQARAAAVDNHKEASSSPSSSSSTSDSSPRPGLFVFLDQTRFDFPESHVTILGCTLHSYITPEQASNVERYLPDFRYVGGDWTTAEHNKAHLADLSWLNAQVRECEGGSRSVVVFTHHNPCAARLEAVDPRFVESVVSSGFSTDLSGEACWTSGVVRMWAFGHTHYNCDFWVGGGVDGVGDGARMVRGKRVLTNQRGYSKEEGRGFDASRVYGLD